MKKLSLILLAIAATVTTSAQAPQPRTVLVVVDDLHVDFRATPQLRTMVDRVARTLVAAGPVSLVSTGTSAVLVSPTTDLDLLATGNRRLTGNALKMAELSLPRLAPATRTELELRSRAARALESAGSALQRLADAQRDRPLTVLYVSAGDNAGDLAERAALIQSAVRGNVRVNAIDMRRLVGATQPQGIDPSIWDEYVSACRASLTELTNATLGTLAGSDAEVDVLLAQLVRRI